MKAEPLEEDPFIRDVLEDGKPHWRMSASLARRHDELRNYSEIEDKKVQAAAVALLIAEARFYQHDDIDPEDFEDWPVHSTEAFPAFTCFLMPLAKRLNALRLPQNSNPKAREKIKSEARAWFNSVIENAFCEFFVTSTPARRAVELIHLAWKLCEDNDDLPCKEELRSAARKSDKKRWGDVQTIRNAEKKAGLKLKDKARGPDKSPRTRRGRSTT